MSTINLFRNAAKNPLTTVVLVVVTIVMAVVIYGNIHDMHAATTGYDYCQSLWVTTIYSGGIYWITIVFFFVPTVRFTTLEAICRELGCQPGDILEYRDENDSRGQVP